ASSLLFRNDKFRKALSTSTLVSRERRDDKYDKKLRQKPVTIARRLLRNAVPDAQERERVLRFVRAAQERLPHTLEPQIRYWSLLEDEPPVFTWKEFHGFFAEWRRVRSFLTLE